MATDEVCDLRQKLADAEARAERLAAALDETLDAYLRTVRFHERDTEWPRAGDLSGGAEIVRTARAALTTPATQPDERAAAERAVIEKARELVSQDGEMFHEFLHRVIALRDALRTLDALDATDGAPAQ